MNRIHETFNNIEVLQLLNKEGEVVFENYQPYIGYGVDFAVICFFVISLIIGYFRTYRESFMLLLIQIFSLFASYSGTILIVKQLLTLFPQDFNVSSLLPQEYQVYLQPYEPHVLPFILDVMMCVCLYILIKSFLCGFNDQYQWGSAVLKDIRRFPFVNRLVSMVLTFMSAYTYVMLFLILLGFPLFKVIGPSSLTQAVLNHSPFYSSSIQLAYEQSEAIKEVVQTIGIDDCTFYEADEICLNDVLRLMVKDETDRTTFIPLIATESAYVQFFEKTPVDEVTMLTHVQTLNQWIEDGVLDKEFINLYYQELLENKIYDKLIKNQIVLRTSIHVLITSNILNDENIEELKEYL